MPGPTVTAAGGVAVAVHDLGGRGPTLVLAHATGFHAFVWAPLATHLTGRFHCVAFDHRAHGDSGQPAAAGFAWSRFADDTAAVAEHLGRPLFGVGHSMGAAAMLLAEARRPGTFAALALYEPVVFPPSVAADPGGNGSNPLAASARRRRPDFASRDEAVANFSSKPPMATFAPEVVAAYVDHGFRPTDDGGVTLKCRPEDEARTYEMAGESGAWDRLGQVSCPVLVLRGRADTGAPAAVAPAIAGRLLRGELHDDDQLGHFGPLEQPARVAAVVVEFLARPG